MCITLAEVWFSSLSHNKIVGCLGLTFSHFVLFNVKVFIVFSFALGKTCFC